MKKLSFILITLFLFMGLGACSQSRVPDAVKTAFVTKFPTVKKADWSREGNTEWEAEFVLNNKDMSANFDRNGNWKETETSLALSELPETVQSALRQNFSDFEAKEAAFSETPSASVYEVIIKKGTTRLEISFDADGKIVSQEKAGND
ncbi:MAG: PepSY-like domain-containing protein [Bacteroidales bacterium]|nr:PepSY-like domain-containing protein [Bacteroidales bacterium]